MQKLLYIVAKYDQLLTHQGQTINMHCARHTTTKGGASKTQFFYMSNIYIQTVWLRFTIFIRLIDNQRGSLNTLFQVVVVGGLCRYIPSIEGLQHVIKKCQHSEWY